MAVCLIVSQYVVGVKTHIVAEIGNLVVCHLAHSNATAALLVAYVEVFEYDAAFPKAHAVVGHSVGGIIERRPERKCVNVLVAFEIHAIQWAVQP